MKKQIIAMVLVGGRGTRLGKITKSTAKPAVTFGGKYRLVDFVLSNLSNSGVSTIGLITQYEPYQLLSYIEHGSTWDLDVTEGGISFLTPYTSMEGENWQKGTAHAINQHFRYIDQFDPDYVLILAGDHVYKMDYNLMINQHIETNADVTISTFEVNDEATRFGIIEMDQNKKIIGFEEKPKKPKSSLASMGIYVFNKKVLKELLDLTVEGKFDFGKDIIPLGLKKGLNIYGYQFSGYFKDVGTIKSLYEANMDLIDNPQYLRINEYSSFPVFTKSVNLPPHHIVKSDKISKSMISDGCLIYGQIIHSIISSGVVIKEDSIIKNTIIHQNVKVEKNCYIENAIIVKDTVVKPNTILKFKEVTVLDNDVLMKLGDNNE